MIWHTIIDFLFHSTPPSSGRRSLISERINTQLFHNLLGDANLFEPIRIDQYLEVLVLLGDFTYDILEPKKHTIKHQISPKYSYLIIALEIETPTFSSFRPSYKYEWSAGDRDCARECRHCRSTRKQRPIGTRRRCSFANRSVLFG